MIPVCAQAPGKCPQVIFRTHLQVVELGDYVGVVLNYHAFFQVGYIQFLDPGARFQCVGEGWRTQTDQFIIVFLEYWVAELYPQGLYSLLRDRPIHRYPADFSSAPCTPFTLPDITKGFGIPFYGTLSRIHPGRFLFLPHVCRAFFSAWLNAVPWRKLPKAKQ